MKGKKVANDRYKFSKNDSDVKADGSFGGKLAENIPIHYQADGEKVITGENNTWIILGRDRNGSIFGDSYGSIGATECGAIDIVVGKEPNAIRRKQDGSSTFVNPNFERDAARIYISQKSDIDKYTAIVKTSKTKALSGTPIKSITQSEKSAGKSGIAVISDNTRIIGRESIKLVTKLYQQNSREGVVDPGGIEIIAHNMIDDNDHVLHPMVRGDNLILALESLLVYVNDIAGILSTFLNFQMDFNNKVVQHTHIQGPPSSPVTSQSPILGLNAQIPLINLLTVTQKDLMTAPGYNSVNFQTTYLMDSGDKYINSHWNKVN